MRSLLRSMGFSRTESLLGIAVMGIVLILALPTMKAHLAKEQGQSAGTSAKLLAQAVLDFNTETGNWPHLHNDQLVFSPAEVAPAKTTDHSRSFGLLGTMTNGIGRAEAGESDPNLAVQPEVERHQLVLDNLALDPWMQPFRIQILEGQGNDKTRPCNVLVISHGKNGRLDSNLEQMKNLSREGRLATGPIINGDDIGYLQQGALRPPPPHQRPNGETSALKFWKGLNPCLASTRWFWNS